MVTWVLLTAPEAYADGISITGGFLDMSPVSGPLVLTGDNGFTFSGGVNVAGGVFNPWLLCTGLSPACAAGGSLSLLGFWLGNDLPGTATYQGVTYSNVGAVNSPTSLSARFDGTATLPPIAATATVQAPFTFTGTFFITTTGTTIANALIGSGIATLTLSQSAVLANQWTLTHARYDFDETPTPEPATMLLFAAGAATIAIARRRSFRT